MKDGTFGFSVVPHKYRALVHHIEVGPFSSNFIFLSALGKFLSADNELDFPMEVVDIILNDIVDFICVLFQVQGDGTYQLWIDESSDAVDFFMDPLI